MLDKYIATIHGNLIEWEGKAPKGLGSKTSMRVEVIPVPQTLRKTGNGKKAAQALRQIAVLGGVRSIKDPSKWQAQIRKDRKVTGRD